MAAAPMQGLNSKLMWYDHYKGSVYPLNLEAPPCCQHKKTSVPSLLEACCSMIVRDSNLTVVAVDSVPQILSIHLMEAALRGNHDRSIQVLMSRWVLKPLVLSKLVPNVFSSILPLYLPLYQADLVRQGLRYTTSLAHTFLECLRQNSPTKIRYLDLTGFPTAEIILYYLTSHCMLVHNEVRRDNVVNLYNQAVSLVEECTGDSQNQHSALNIDMKKYLPDDISIVIKLDALVTSESCHSELCKALTVSSFPGARFQIIIEKLSVTCLGRDRISLLLRQIKPEIRLPLKIDTGLPFFPQHLKGLQLKYNSLRIMDFIHVAPIIQSLCNLTSLDLSCNHISLVETEPMAIVMRHALSTLKKLERLDLSDNRLKNKLGSVLIGLSNPLKQLRLTACGLTNADITALSTCVNVDKIEEIDLSENNLTISETPFLRLLGKIKPTVKILEIEDCSITDDVINVLLATFQSGFHDLLFLNVAENSWDSTSTKTFASVISNLHKIKVLRLSYPRDCYPIEGFDGMVEEEESKDLFRAAVNDMVEMNTPWQFRSQHLEMVYVDLERTME